MSEEEIERIRQVVEKHNVKIPAIFCGGSHLDPDPQKRWVEASSPIHGLSIPGSN